MDRITKKIEKNFEDSILKVTNGLIFSSIG